MKFDKARNLVKLLLAMCIVFCVAGIITNGSEAGVISALISTLFFVMAFVVIFLYCKCPNCGNIHYIYGKSNIDETARELGIKTVAKMPIDPEVAKHIDAGRAEELDTAALDGVFEAIKNC